MTVDDFVDVLYNIAKEDTDEEDIKDKLFDEMNDFLESYLYNKTIELENVIQESLDEAADDINRKINMILS